MTLAIEEFGAEAFPMLPWVCENQYLQYCPQVMRGRVPWISRADERLMANPCR
jgi:hypothetical protein